MMKKKLSKKESEKQRLSDLENARKKVLKKVKPCAICGEKPKIEFLSVPPQQIGSPTVIIYSIFKCCGREINTRTINNLGSDV
jgi:hypothetical protein